MSNVTNIIQYKQARDPETMARLVMGSPEHRARVAARRLIESEAREAEARAAEAREEANERWQTNVLRLSVAYAAIITVVAVLTGLMI